MKKIIQILLILLISFIHKEMKADEPVTKAWSRDINFSLNSINKAVALLVDNQENCYVLGNTWFSDSSKNIILEKIDPMGNQLWIRSYDSNLHGDDIPTSMSLDPNGNIWITGISRSASGKADILLVKFNSDGIPVFDYLHDGPGHLFDCGNYITSDIAGNIFVGGYETSLDSGINIITMCFKQSGELAWRRSFCTLEMDVANMLLADDSSNVYVCGTINNGLHSGDIVVLKYDLAGKKKWQFVFNGQLSQSDFGKFITADDSMNIYVSGFVNHSNDRADIPVLKLNRNGRLLQESFYNGRIADCGAVNLLAAKNTVYVTGSCLDYNISENSTFIFSLTKGGKEKYTIKAPDDVRIISNAEIAGSSYIFGAKTVHPESTLIPFIAQNDSVDFQWTFSDSLVYGLSHILTIASKGNNVYFLGDDTGEANGTIRVFKYKLNTVPTLNPKIFKKRNK
jgi:hypothetical protein